MSIERRQRRTRLAGSIMVIAAITLVWGLAAGRAGAQTA
jgi:hypothetical protein